MVICSCQAVSDRAVRAAIAEGAATVEDVGARCAAATGCGGCWNELERLIEEYAGRRDDRVAAVA